MSPCAKRVCLRRAKSYADESGGLRVKGLNPGGGGTSTTPLALGCHKMREEKK